MRALLSRRLQIQSAFQNPDYVFGYRDQVTAAGMAEPFLELAQRQHLKH
jgi:hypothetical protein